MKKLKHETDHQLVEPIIISIDIPYWVFINKEDLEDSNDFFKLR